MRRWAWIAATGAALGALTAAAAAQARVQERRHAQTRTQSQSSAKMFSFRASTHLVQINIVVDGHHGPVFGLTAKDFTVRDNGKLRSIAVFAENTARAASPAASGSTEASAESAFAHAAGSYSNHAARARSMVVVLIDSLNTPNTTRYYFGQPTWRSSQAFQFAKQGALAFLKTVPSDDRVAVYGLAADGLRVLSGFTDDHAQLTSALRAYNPVADAGLNPGSQAPTGVPGDFNALKAQAADSYAGLAALRAGKATVNALTAIGRHVAPLPGRISLVWLTSAPPLSGAQAEAALGGNNVAVYTVDARGLMGREGVQPVSGIDGWPMSNGQTVARLQTQPPALKRLQDIARETGGRAFINTNGIAQAITAAANDSSDSYTLGFYVSRKALDNHFHHLLVRVRRKGAKARYPHGYWAMAHSAAPTLATSLQAALASPVPERGLGMSVQLLPQRKDGAVRVVGTLDVHNLRFSKAGNRQIAAVRLVIVTQDAAGALRQSAGYRIRLALDPAQYGRLLAAGYRFSELLYLANGAVTLRIIAVDENSDTTGSLIVPLPH
jgi:VWFA-related protein